MLPVRIKFAGEARKLTFDFASKLGVGDTLTGGASVTGSAGITIGSPSSDLPNGLATVLISGGTLGADYIITCSHGTTGGETLILEVTVEVRADVN